MQRIVKVLAVAVLVATVLVISSIPAFARPLRGGVEVSSRVCHTSANDLESQSGEFHWEDPATKTVCWHTSEGLERASDVVPPE